MGTTDGLAIGAFIIEYSYGVDNLLKFEKQHLLIFDHTVINTGPSFSIYTPLRFDIFQPRIIFEESFKALFVFGMLNS